jgi:hypothetical protein
MTLDMWKSWVRKTPAAEYVLHKKPIPLIQFFSRLTGQKPLNMAKSSRVTG